MIEFTAYNPTKLHFGRGTTGDLGVCARTFGKRALLVYGGGSVKRNGSFDDTLRQLEGSGITVTEFGGIKPNPLVDDVNRASAIGIKEEVDMVVAVGGGSVIDSAKVIAVCVADRCDGWDVMARRHKPVNALPIISVLTLAATGTEMNMSTVLQNRETREKVGLRNELFYPAHSFLDPMYTRSVPADYTAYGIVDLVAHCLEAWFGEGEASLSDRIVISIIREAFEYGPALMKDLDSYQLRAKIMWAATVALNNTTLHGRKSGDWGAHRVSHVLSFLYDTPHGATLSIIYPAWIRVMFGRVRERTEKLGQELFGTTELEGVIEGLKSFFLEIGSPVRCQDAGIEPSCRSEILELLNENRAEGLHHKLSDTEREEILSHLF